MDTRHLTVVHGQGRPPASRPAGRRQAKSPRAVGKAGPAIAPTLPPPEPSFMRDSYAATAFAEVLAEVDARFVNEPSPQVSPTLKDVPGSTRKARQRA